MKTVTAALFSVQDTAALLSEHLGSGRQWVDFLNDCRQQRGSIEGCVLLPLRHAPGSPAARRQPLYHPKAVVDFILRVRELKGVRVPYPFVARYYTYEVADGSEGLMWRVMKARPSERPSAALR